MCGLYLFFVFGMKTFASDCVATSFACASSEKGFMLNVVVFFRLVLVEVDDEVVVVMIMIEIVVDVVILVFYMVKYGALVFGSFIEGFKGVVCVFVLMFDSVVVVFENFDDDDVLFILILILLFWLLDVFYCV